MELAIPRILFTDSLTSLVAFTLVVKAVMMYLYFFGNLNPFSNFHPVKFDYNRHTYHSSEQLIQHAKDILFYGEEAASRTLNSQTPYECKTISHEILNYDHEKWKNCAKELCEGGITTKFEQNPNIAKLLLSTESKTLTECCYDIMWGTGVPLSNEQCLKPEKWNCQGILGEILEEVRNTLLITHALVTQ